MDVCNDNVQCVLDPGGQRTVNVSTNDAESDEDDNAPISTIMRNHLEESIPDKSNCNSDGVKGPVTRSRQCLVTMSQSKGKCQAAASSSSKTNYQGGISTTDDVEDDESEEVGSACERKSSVPDDAVRR